MRNKEDIDVIISQERFDELLEKEKIYDKIKDDKSIILGYKYLESSYRMNVVANDSDIIASILEIGKDIPQPIKDYVNKRTLDIIERVDAINEYRLHKIEKAKQEILHILDESKRRDVQPPFSILVWLGLKKLPEEI